MLHRQDVGETSYATRDVGASRIRSFRHGLFGADDYFRYVEHRWQLWLFTYVIAFLLFGCLSALVFCFVLSDILGAIIASLSVASVMAMAWCWWCHAACRKYFHSRCETTARGVLFIDPAPPMGWVGETDTQIEQVARFLATALCPAVMVIRMVALVSRIGASQRQDRQRNDYYAHVERDSVVGPALRQAMEHRDKLNGMVSSPERDIALALAERKIQEIQAIPLKIRQDEDRVRAAAIINELLAVDERAHALLDSHNEQMECLHNDDIRTALEAAAKLPNRQLDSGQPPKSKWQALLKADEIIE